MLDSLPGKVTSAGFSGLDATEPPNTYQRAVVNAAKSEGVTEGVIELCSLPVELQEVLAPFDANGNGRLEVQELATFSDPSMSCVLAFWRNLLCLQQSCSRLDDTYSP